MQSGCAQAASVVLTEMFMILMSSKGLSFLSVLLRSIIRTTSAPLTTCKPTITY